MSTLLPGIFDELVQRLAVGLEPRDAVSQTRIARPVDIAIDGTPRFDEQAPPWPEQSPVAGLPRLVRHGSGRFVLLYGPMVQKHKKIPLRLVPRERKYVPRRVQVEIFSEAAVIASEGFAADVPTTFRTWRPLLFPGAGYDLAETATGVRGTVTRAGQAVRWARVEASVNGTIIGRAHGDDRGEFLLILGQNTGQVGDLVSPLNVTITVFARDVAFPLPVKKNDLLADLTLETAAAAGVTPDDVSTGITLPEHYVQITQLANHQLTLGRLSSVPIAV